MRVHGESENNFAGHKCDCATGYKWEAWDSHCENFDESDYGTHDCSEIEECENRGGSFAGVGKLSYDRNDTSGVCEDIDEFVLGSHICVEVESNFCFNTVGSFVCDY